MELHTVEHLGRLRTLMTVLHHPWSKIRVSEVCLAGSVLQHATLDLGGHELEPHVGPRAYLGKKKRSVKH